MGGPPTEASGFVLENTIGIQFAGRATETGINLNSGFMAQVHPPAGPLAIAIAVDDVVTIDEDTSVEIDVLANDIAPVGESLRISALQTAAHGSAVVGGGKIRYTPRSNFFGQDSIGYTVGSPTGGASSANVLITVRPVNDAPVFKSTPATSAVVGSEYIYTIEVEDVDNASLQLSIPTRPSWLSANTNQDGTATLSGVPAAADVGENPVKLLVSDGDLSQEQSFTIEVAASGVAAPQLVAPENNAVVAPPAVTVTWNPVPGAQSYDLQADDNEAFSSPVEANGLERTEAQLTGLSDGLVVFWRIRAVGPDGPGPYSATFRFTTAANVATENQESLPVEFSLGANYPNPFNPSTTIPYELPETAHVMITIYDLFGREVARLVDDTISAGRHSVTFEAGNLPSGSYFYRLETSEWSDVRQLLLLK
jgi:hypothetical protein